MDLILNIEIEENVTLGSIVDIDGKYYIVNELPSCVHYGTKPEWRHYLHSLNGSGYWCYPLPLDELKALIKRNKWKVYNEHNYCLQLKSIE